MDLNRYTLTHHACIGQLLNFLEDLRLVDTAEDESDDEADSDDEDAPSSPSPLRDEDMTATALNLLLAVLEGAQICMNMELY